MIAHITPEAFRAARSPRCTKATSSMIDVDAGTLNLDVAGG